MAITGVADMDDAAGPGFDHRLQPGKHRVGRADHGVERAFPGLFRRAAERCVNIINIKRVDLGGERHGRRRVGCRAIDNHGALPQAFLQPRGAADDRLDFARAGDADEDDIGDRRNLARR